MQQDHLETMISTRAIFNLPSGNRSLASDTSMATCIELNLKVREELPLKCIDVYESVSSSKND